mmetsp:Transcript_4652/g.7209  ORF Transcript_4652/g.7209 Transcript_4652/m.7209 type:complete len:276 (+) Transcript_4652:277-1104(+)|eukprot:CAMPEP_0184649964 /NCGR_PEP_ID=MMETSP0308-20130426/7428_1 /TAXON_ID=38269 /ORGANISM="Gloeochaete witrockiana, Strain SAG 46.84" /LENGTH=275 /DNA_ID=CAMNT_0027083129 /DNA_START=255 /DNA_END=1079 /DNA_ORIENTATION=-
MECTQTTSFRVVIASILLGSGVLCVIFWRELLFLFLTFALFIDELGPVLGPATLMFLMFLTSFPLPGCGSLVIASGFIYGLWGFLYSYVATTFGAITCFLVARFWFQDKTQKLLSRHFPRLHIFDTVIREGGLRDFLLVRLAPLPFGASNALFGALQVQTHHFVIATAVVNLKELLYVLIGSSAHDLADLLQGGKSGSGSTHAQVAVLVIGLSSSIAAFLVISLKAKQALDRISSPGCNNSIRDEKDAQSDAHEIESVQLKQLLPGEQADSDEEW